MSIIRTRRCPPIEVAKKYFYEDPKDGLEVRFINKEKGRGVFATKEFLPGEFICCYRGNLALKRSLKEVERRYEIEDAGSFVFDFIHLQQQMCIDATVEDESFGRIINDSKYFPNAYVRKVVDSKCYPHLAIFAKKKISRNEEITFFYGEDDLPWHHQEKIKYEEHLEAQSCFKRNIKYIAVPPILQSIKNIQDDKEFTEDKPIFEKLLLLIDQPIPIVYGKINLFEQQEEAKAKLMKDEKAGMELSCSDQAADHSLEEKKNEFISSSPVLFDTFNTPIYFNDNKTFEREEKSKIGLTTNPIFGGTGDLPSPILKENKHESESESDGESDIDYYCKRNRNTLNRNSSVSKLEEGSEDELMKPTSQLLDNDFEPYYSQASDHSTNLNKDKRKPRKKKKKKEMKRKHQLIPSKTSKFPKNNKELDDSSSDDNQNSLRKKMKIKTNGACASPVEDVVIPNKKELLKMFLEL